MALSSRLALRAALQCPNGGYKWVHSTSSMAHIKSVSPEEHTLLKEEFWHKNKRLQRPPSPHLTIYKPQMTSMLSITHRGTGLFQSAILSGVAGFAILSNTTFPVALSAMQTLNPALVFLGKFAIAWPVCYHFFNGLRHLAWDLGYGFNMPDLYK